MNPVTQIMCVTGPCFDKPPKWNVSTRHQVGQVPTVIKHAVRHFLSDADLGKAPKLPAFDYWAVLDELTTIPELSGIDNEDDHDPTTETVQTLGEALGPEFVQQSHRVHDYLRQKLPIQTVKSIGGSKNVLPNTVDILRFRHMYRLALDPLSILEDLKAGSITSQQVKSLKDLYPDVYQDVQAAIFEGVQKEVAKKKYGVPHKEVDTGGGRKSPGGIG